MGYEQLCQTIFTVAIIVVLAYLACGFITVKFRERMSDIKRYNAIRIIESIGKEYRNSTPSSEETIQLVSKLTETAFDKLTDYFEKMKELV